MIKLGIISLEHPHSTGNHLPALRYLTDKIKVAAIYNPTYEDAEKYLQDFNANYCKTRDELLAMRDIDAVLITSKNLHHADDCIAAAQSGKDIFCDKPIATSYEDAKKILKAVNESKVNFITTYPVRFNIAVQKLKAKIDAGELGDITAIMATNHGCMYEPSVPNWVKIAKLNGGGCLIDHSVHVADIIRLFTKSEFSSVLCEAQNSLREYIDAEDIAVLHGTLKNGCIYQIDTSWSRRGSYSMWGDVTFRVVGTKGSASLDIYNNQRLEVYTQNEELSFYPNNIIREHGEIFYDYWKYKTLGDKMINAGIEDGVRSVQLAYAGYASIESGTMISINK